MQKENDESAVVADYRSVVAVAVVAAVVTVPFLSKNKN